jgi:histone deacetylase complex regulatory component SIN3
MDIRKLVLDRKHIENKISILKNSISDLNREVKDINKLILQNCVHNWIRDYTNFSYDERPYKCTICNMNKN